MSKDGIQNLVEFMVQDIMEMSDEEVLAEVSPEEIERIRAMMDREIEKMLLGPAPQKRRQTALRVRGTVYETVELDDDGKIIEPVRCTCGGMIVLHRPSCPFYCLTT